ncbi:MAG: ABC transporter ATP-binding protein [Actinomycetes bacterium]
MSTENAVEIQDVSKRFRLYHERGTSLKERLVKAGRSRYEDLWALKNVGFNVAEGETVGILGRNGSGKSTLLKCICGVLQPTEGQVVVRGKLAGLLELGAGFQPELSGRDNIYLNASMLGLSRKEVDDVFDDIVAFAELDHFIDNQVKFYSSGMYVRLGFAVAVNVDPDILVVDEVLAVGDERFQNKCIERIRQFQDQGRTIIFVSHSADQVRSICDRAVVLQDGHMMGDSTPDEAVRTFREGLLEASAVLGEADADEPEEAEADATPPQARAVTITGVTITAGNDEPVTRLATRGPCELTVHYSATEAIDDVVVAVEVLGPQGGRFVITDTDVAGLRVDIAPGDGAITFAFETFPLCDRMLNVSAGIRSRAGGTTYDWKESTAHFSVEYGGRATGVLNLPMTVTHQHGGVVERSSV